MGHKTWKVGDAVWIISADGRGKPILTEVVKVGRLFATLTHYNARMRLDSGYVTSRDFHIGHGWRSLEEYGEAADLNKQWSEMVRRLTHIRPQHITSKDITTIKGIIEGNNI